MCQKIFLAITCVKCLFAFQEPFSSSPRNRRPIEIDFASYVVEFVRPTIKYPQFHIRRGSGCSKWKTFSHWEKIFLSMAGWMTTKLKILLNLFAILQSNGIILLLSPRTNVMRVIRMASEKTGLGIVLYS